MAKDKETVIESVNLPPCPEPATSKSAGGSKLTKSAHREFNQYVNMTRQELRDWLQVCFRFPSPTEHRSVPLAHEPFLTTYASKTEDSTSAGWAKNDGSGESVGHDSGRHIVEILEKNPSKGPGK